MSNYIPTRQSQLDVTSDAFLRSLRETEFIRTYEDRLELDSLITDDPAYHPLGA